MAKNNKQIKFFLPAIGVILFLTIAACVLSFFVPSDPFNPEKKTVLIKYGTSIKSVAKELNRAKVIRSPELFRLFFRIGGMSSKVKAGEYEFSGMDSMASVAYKLINGDFTAYTVTIPEGSNIYDIAAAIERKKIGNAQRFLELCKDTSFLKKIGINAALAEGFLFPDTYSFSGGIGEEKIIETMFARFLERSGLDMKKIYRIAGRDMSAYRVLIMASIIESEIKVDSERALAASVFYNRLNSPEKYMKKLESCATVRYGINKHKGRLLYSDLKIDTPYNTYIYIGLPPTPICNPGVKSIEAALKPAQTGYRYFVAKGDGGHFFSETLEGHNRAKNTYRKMK